MFNIQYKCSNSDYIFYIEDKKRVMNIHTFSSEFTIYY